MGSAPNVWEVGENILIELFVADLSDNHGLVGQAAFIELKIQRMSDNYYWNGTGWTLTPTNLVMTEADETNQPGRYTYTFTGNSSANKYVAYAKVDNPPLVTGSSYEVHISRSLEVNVYESEPVHHC